MPFWIELIAGLLSFVIAAIGGKLLIPFLHKLKFGQPIKVEFGPKWHEGKQGTPTMGGIMFIVGILFASCLAFFFLADAPITEKIRYGSGLVMALGYGLLGFIDDYTKIARKQNEGLTAKQKLIGQVLLAVMFLVGLQISGTLSTTLIIPLSNESIRSARPPSLITLPLSSVIGVNISSSIFISAKPS